MSRIEDQANYYKNYHLRYRNTVSVIHVESEDDKRFWTAELQNVKAGEYHFISHSKNERGIDTKGCEQCLKYVPFLNRHFFICVDSDLRLLSGDLRLSVSNFIAQTYVYSWEKHSCEAVHLQDRFKEKVPDVEFNFISFLNNLSEILYKPLLFLVYYQTAELNNLWNVSRFNKCIPIQLRRDELANNGLPYIQKIQRLFNIALDSLTIPEGYNIDQIGPENAYLHIQGHRLYDLILYIGTLLCKGKGVAFKSEVLDKGFPVFGYTEIENVQSDLSIILQDNS